MKTPCKARSASGRLTLPGIAAPAAWPWWWWCSICRSASRPPESRRLRHERGRDGGDFHLPPHAPRNRGACGGWDLGDVKHAMLRLAPPGIAAPAAGDAELGLDGDWCRLTPPGIAAPAASRCPCPSPTLTTASRPPESRRLRQNLNRTRCIILDRLTPPGIAAPAASAPPPAPSARRSRLTPPGIAAPAAPLTSTSCSQPSPASRPRNRGACGDSWRINEGSHDTPPHAPRNRGACGRLALTSCKSTSVALICERNSVSTEIRFGDGSAQSILPD